MKNKIVKLILVTMTAAIAATGCGATHGSNSNKTEKEDNAGLNDTGSEDNTETGKDDTAESKREESSKKEDDGATAECGAIDPSSIHFYINGEKYTIGDATLQDLMDDGVTIGNYNKTDILAFIGDVSDYEYTIELGNGERVGVETLNDVDEPAHTSECKVWYLGWNASDAGESDAIQFDFSTDITEDKLKEIAGEPTETEQYADINELSYIKEAGETECGGKYVFSFIDGELIGVSLYWEPSYEILSKQASDRGWQYLPD